MDFRIDAVLPATAAQLWDIFFDVKRVATLIPGCENVVEIEPLRQFSAVMKQKIGPFKLEVPTRIEIESHTLQRQVVLVAAGRDRFTGTSIDVRMKVDLEQAGAQAEGDCKLGVEASMQVAGRLASLGYPIVKKRSEELFAEFERRLRAELSGVGLEQVAEPSAVAGPTLPSSTWAAPSDPVPSGPAVEPSASEPDIRSQRPALPDQGVQAPVNAYQPLPRPSQRSPVELVLLWPRVGISLVVGLAVAHGATAFGQSPWWWLAAPLLGVAAGLGKRQP